MTAERLAEIREAAATKAPAHAADHRRELLDHVREMECARDLAVRRCEDWFAIAQTLRAEVDTLLVRVQAAEGRHQQNVQIRKMWLEERRRKASPELQDRVEELAREVRDLQCDLRNAEEDAQEDRDEVDRLRKLVPYECQWATPGEVRR
jgi:uncharacterized protein YlxW (UPF0749 family)